MQEAQDLLALKALSIFYLSSLFFDFIDKNSFKKNEEARAMGGFVELRMEIPLISVFCVNCDEWKLNVIHG